MFATIAFRFLIFKILSNYNSNNTKTLKYIFYSSYISVRKKKGNTKIKIGTKRYMR